VHHSYEFTIQQGLDAISDVIYHLETFDVTTVRSATPMFLMSRKIKSLGIKMVLSGEGSDEMFGGYLYFHKAPNPKEFHEETVRKLQALYMFDNLRANKATSAWGLEARVPFLDVEFLDYVMNIETSAKMCGNGKIEKHILRAAFDTPDSPYLPKHILWRQKEQFSDGVGYSWIDSLRDTAASKVTDGQMQRAKHLFPTNTPTSKEAYYYRSIFHKHYPQESAALTVPEGMSIACSTPISIKWDKMFQNRADPSGRAVFGVHAAAHTEDHDFGIYSADNPKKKQRTA